MKQKKIHALLYWLLLSLALIMLALSTRYNQLWHWRYRDGGYAGDLSTYHLKWWGGAGFSGGYIHQGNQKVPILVTQGDSHSGMLDIGIMDVIARPFNITTYTASGGGAGRYLSCIGLPGLTRIFPTEQKSFDQSCQEEYNDALHVLNRHPHSVLMISYAYSDQLRIAGYAKTHRYLHIHPKTDSKYDDYQPLINALNQLKSRMQGHSLIIIGQVPGSAFVPFKCFGTPIFFKKPARCMAVDKITRSKGAVNVNRILAEYAKTHKNIYFLNPYNVFCTKTYCRSLNKEGVPFYSDGSHLSKTGSIYLIKHLKAKILKILQPPSAKS